MLKYSQRAVVSLPWHELYRLTRLNVPAVFAARPAQGQFHSSWKRDVFEEISWLTFRPAARYLPSRTLSSTPTRRAPENENEHNINDEGNENTPFAATAPTDVASTVPAQAYWWSFADDHKLLAMVQKHGNNWGAIREEAFPHLPPFIIRQRWIKHVDPTLNIGNRWTVADDLILLTEIASGVPYAIPRASKKLRRHTSYVNKRFDFHWKHHLLVQAYGSAEQAEGKVETRIYGKPFSPAFRRAAQEIVNELSLLPPTSRHQRKIDYHVIPFTQEENERLLEAVRDVGRKWGVLQREFPFRTQSDLQDQHIKLTREKYFNDKPSATIKEGPARGVAWTEAEDALVREGRNRFGKLRAWALRTWQTLLPHRTPGMIANRYRTCLSPDFDRGEFTKEEVQALKDAIQQWDIRTQMKQIRRYFLPRRLPGDIRRAYLDLPVTDYRRFTPQETALLEKLMQEKTKMEDILPFFPDRPPHELIAHYMRDVTDRQRKAAPRDWKSDPDWRPEIDEYVTRMKKDGQMSFTWISRQLDIPYAPLRERHGRRGRTVATKATGPRKTLPRVADIRNTRS
ncbi:hypothetical protein HDU87_001369 [Geranomyces variabilis]|uniref:Myb-like domain-containing protein n=1 Tax=Geranomyces variabilis TaxID=109894 RepID=A0AAD5TMM9_9FUNG|nr:hypothetical protein HDU87_001369 [Geranomyces variabilis]